MLKSVALLSACALLAAAAAAAGGGRARRSRVHPEDANLDVPQLIAKYNYPVEVHRVRTADGYLLEMHRIPRGRDAPAGAPPREPVLLVHGLISSSADFVLLGPGHGLAYVLADAGHDVWLANTRGNHYSRRHSSRNPDRDNSFWNFSFEQIGTEDLPAMIDYTLNVTDHEKLFYLGHSQGSTAFLTLASLLPEYNAKILQAHLMAPVATLSDVNNPTLNIFAQFSNSITTIGTVLGMTELLPRNNAFQVADGEVSCKPGNSLGFLCDSFIPIFAGPGTDMELMSVIVGHTPAGTSIKSVAHFGQSMSSGHFRQWGYTTPIQNLARYGTWSPPHIDLSLVTARSFLHTSVADVLTPPSDVAWLASRLPNAEVRPVPAERFSHFDFAWSWEASDVLYATIISIMNSSTV